MLDYSEPMTCKHCGDSVIFTGHTAKGFDTDYLHSNMIRRCLPAKTGQPYGLEADILNDNDVRNLKHLEVIKNLPMTINLEGLNDE